MRSIFLCVFESLWLKPSCRRQDPILAPVFRFSGPLALFKSAGRIRILKTNAQILTKTIQQQEEIDSRITQIKTDKNTFVLND